MQGGASAPHLDPVSCASCPCRSKIYHHFRLALLKMSLQAIISLHRMHPRVQVHHLPTKLSSRHSNIERTSPGMEQLLQAFQNVACCGPLYDVKIKDNSDNDVLQLLETCSCTCTREMEVHCPPGCPVGFVKVHNNLMVTHLSILNCSKEVTLIILGPRFQNSIFGNVTFEVSHMVFDVCPTLAG
ncbi:unnamed protein product [Ranitomeya imitator]|uniref:Phospholipid scramblase n=1 Tax=Ranitomeya imitator TaxID=111125 RepID=A0ABN9MNR8_9NEOB|nr:unnamed protein product [Ranitomeya imitator]